MKHILSGFAIALVMLSFTYQQGVDYSLARVKKTNGKLVFYHNEPVNEYDVAFTFKNHIHNLNCITVQQASDASIKNANVESGNQGRSYDAVVVGTSDRDMAVTFKDKSKDNSIARVDKSEGKYVFLFCEPQAAYDIVGEYTVEGIGQQLLDGTCPTLQDKIDKLIKKGGKANLTFDGVMFGSSEKNQIIKLK